MSKSIFIKPNHLFNSCIISPPHLPRIKWKCISTWCVKTDENSNSNKMDWLNTSVQSTNNKENNRTKRTDMYIKWYWGSDEICHEWTQMNKTRLFCTVLTKTITVLQIQFVQQNKHIATISLHILFHVSCKTGIIQIAPMS